MTVRPFCICRRLVDLGLAEAIDQGSATGQGLLAAVWDCIEGSDCPDMAHARPPPAPPPAPAPAAETPPHLRERSGKDRRSGVDRRQQTVAVKRERRSGEERRKGDRRGLLAGQSYSPEEMVANLTAWCNDKCEGEFEIGFTGEGSQRQLTFHFDIDTDRMKFMSMLRNYKRPKVRGG